MSKAITSIFCCLAVFGASAGDSRTPGSSLQDSPLQKPAPQTAPAGDPSSTKPVEVMTEAEIRTEIDFRERRVDDAKKALKQMIAARNFSGGTELMHAAELDKRRVALLKKQLKERKEKASTASDGNSTPAK